MSVIRVVVQQNYGELVVHFATEYAVSEGMSIAEAHQAGREFYEQQVAFVGGYVAAAEEAGHDV